MKKIILSFILGLTAIASINAKTYTAYGINHSNNVEYQYNQNNATITFKNKSEYVMTLKIMNYGGGLYSTIYLPANSSKVVSFSRSATYNLKIKAVRYGQASYHKGGQFSVTCTREQWTEGEMSFSLSSYGSGLGPSISAKEFESNN